MRKLASAVAKREGKRSQTSIGNVRETLSALIQILAEERVSGTGSTAPFISEFTIALEKAIAKLNKKKAVK